MADATIELTVTGDMVLDEPDAGYWLSGIAPVLRASDLAIAHLEVPHTASHDELEGDVPAPGAPPENLAALAAAGVGMVSLAGNHMADCGAQGIADTVAGLDAHGVRHTGAGLDLAAARRAAVASVKGRRIALLSYNCVGPEASWASESESGCAYLPMGTADGSPVTPQKDIVSVLPGAREILAQDIAAAREQADIVLVAMHKGLVHRPAVLAPYERPVAQAAIDLGADAVIAHHAHIVKGIEFYCGKPIFHGLGNGCVVTSALSPDQDHPARADWAHRRKAMFGFEPDPAYRLAPFHPEAINAFMGRLLIDKHGGIVVGIIPVHVEAPGRPVLADAARGREIAAYVEKITCEAGLPVITIDEDYTVRAAA